jgi:hypothetical protein
VPRTDIDGCRMPQIAVVLQELRGMRETRSDPHEYRAKTLFLRLLAVITSRTVTHEVAGSRPVVPAMSYALTPPVPYSGCQFPPLKRKKTVTKRFLILSKCKKMGSAF